jgi:lysophospholipase L1-like esterase
MPCCSGTPTPGRLAGVSTKKVEHVDWIFLGLAAAAAVGLVRSLRCEPIIRQGDTVLLVGDSLAVGLTPFLRKMAQASGAGFVSHAAGGTTMRNWLNNTAFRQALDASGATVVLVSLGTNDTYGSWTAEQLAADAQQLLALVRGSGRKVLWILPPKLPKEDRASAGIRATGVDVVESSQLDIAMGPDFIHPTGSGYAFWASAVWRKATCASAGAEVPASGLGAVRRRPSAPPAGFLRRRPTPSPYAVTVKQPSGSTVVVRTPRLSSASATASGRARSSGRGR